MDRTQVKHKNARHISFCIWEMEKGAIYPATTLCGVSQIELPVLYRGKPLFLQRVDETTVKILMEFDEEIIRTLAQKTGIELSKEFPSTKEGDLITVATIEDCKTYKQTVNLVLGWDKNTKWGEDN